MRDTERNRQGQDHTTGNASAGFSALIATLLPGTFLASSRRTAGSSGPSLLAPSHLVELRRSRRVGMSQRSDGSDDLATRRADPDWELTIDIGRQPAVGVLRAARPPGTWPELIDLPALQLLRE